MKFSELIIDETDDWIAVNKSAGLLSIPDREGKEISLKLLLKEKYGEIFTVHRLDKETSGLIVFAKNEATHKNLSLQFEGRETKKIYRGLVIGSLEEKEKSPNNIILKNGSKTYILFYNPHEKSGSQVVYEATKAQHEKIELDKTYKKDDKFAYLLLEQLEEDMNEVTVGIGGTKITTETKTSSMKNEAKTMMEIVSSVKMK